MREHDTKDRWQHVRNEFIDLCRAHRRQRAGGKTHRGSKSPIPSTPRVTRASSRRSLEQPVGASEALIALLASKNVDEVLAFGFFRDDKWHYTVTFTPTDEEPDAAYMGTHFVCPDRSYATFEAALIQRLEQWHGTLDMEAEAAPEEEPVHRAPSARRGGAQRHRRKTIHATTHTSRHTKTRKTKKAAWFCNIQ